LLKTCASTELVIAVREVLRGETYLSRALSKDDIHFMRRNSTRESEDRLTERERDVLQLLAEGRVAKEIGDTLGITARTVVFHKYRMMEVLGIKTNAELIRYAVRTHVVAA
jgi:DNA-binding NarL/FixJ family response regulator